MVVDSGVKALITGLVGLRITHARLEQMEHLKASVKAGSKQMAVEVLVIAFRAKDLAHNIRSLRLTGK